MRFFKPLLAVAALLFSTSAFAQPKFYLPDTSVKVYAFGYEQTTAFCGGFNNPQFAMADLNHDGLQDLVVFEPWNSLRTFINTGSAGNPNYRYAPEYARNFPPLYSYMVMADYNCDGVADLFHRGTTGFEVYRGYYNGLNQLCFTYYRQLFYDNDLYAGGPANAYCNPGDIPAIVDVDNDGDLDFIAYDISGGWLNLYKNMRVEMGLPCDSIHIALKDRCWGRVFQGFYRTHQLARTCDETHLMMPVHDGGKKNHSGNTPCLFDWDMDEDYDYLDGSVSWNEMTFLKNGRIENGSGPDSMVAQDTMWQTGGKTISMPTFPAAFNIDYDQDGLKDLVIAPNAFGVGVENYKCIWYYKNFSSAGSPDWRFQSDSFIIDRTIDLGTGAYPMFFDYDKDGKPDMFVGSEGYYQGTGSLQGRLSYYRNTSTTGAPSFTLQSRDLLGMSTHDFRGVAPAAGDIDGDGKSDLVVGHTDGTLSYYKNIASTDSVTPNWQLTLTVLTDMNGDTINVGGHAAPFIYDMDHDGKKDLIIGDVYGYIQYYQNIATTPGAIRLKLINTQLGGAKVDTTRFNGIDATPFIGKIDSTGIEYLLVGSNSGNIYRFTGFQTGDTTAHYTMLDAQYSYIDSTYSQFNHHGTSYGVYDNIRSTVTVGDIAGDGNYYMMVGNNKGGLESYKLKTYIPTIDHSGLNTVNADARVLVYPNPAGNSLNISWSGLAQPLVTITFMNMAGQVLGIHTVPATPGHITLPVTDLPNGMYLCVLQGGVSRYYTKFTVVR